MSEIREGSIIRSFIRRERREFVTCSQSGCNFKTPRGALREQQAHMIDVHPDVLERRKKGSKTN